MRDSSNPLDAAGPEAGQTTIEYTAMTAIALFIAIAVVWSELGGALADAITAMFEKLNTFLGA